MPDLDLLVDDFEAHRRHLRAVAYRMLGSFSDADDAVQEAWLRCSQADASTVDNIGGWLTTIVARICLNMLRTRRMRGERPLDWSVPDPVVDFDPEGRAVASDAVGLALLVVPRRADGRDRHLGRRRPLGPPRPVGLQYLLMQAVSEPATNTSRFPGGGGG